jgi:amino acid adenylation domain-containing protein
MITLLDGFCSVAERQPDRPALEVAESVLSYGELDRRAGAVARVILAHEQTGPLVALLAYRSVAAYAGVLGILGAGRGYVPLNPHFPLARTRTMFELSRCTTIVVAEEGARILEALLPDFPHSLTVVCICVSAQERWSRTYPQHLFVPVPADGDGIPRDVVRGTPHDGNAYLLFTSGSTGVPKGVAVSHRNVTSYLQYVSARYGFIPDDRFSQTFDMTFDLSVHDMFVCWSNGACLVAMPQATVMAPSTFIRDKRLTVWFSVPSVILFLQRLRAIRPGLFPSLRLSLFCGEPLLSAWAAAWQAAASQSIVENVYGPTETTIAIAHYRWNRDAEANRCTNGVVPIGTVFDTQRAVVMTPTRVPACRGSEGELWLSGPQVTAGYLDNAEKTREQFVTWDSTVWYRTGDLVREDESGILQYLGRLDDQVQIFGYRVEMQEVDHAIRTSCGNSSAVAVAWPVRAGRAEAIYAFVCAPAETDAASILAECQRRLPAYMVPKRVFFLESMPVNANGKIDRVALGAMVEQLR